MTPHELPVAEMMELLPLLLTGNRLLKTRDGATDVALDFLQSAGEEKKQRTLINTICCGFMMRNLSHWDTAEENQT